MEQPVITFALAKGRLAEQAFDLLEQLGIDCSEPRNPGRQLVLWDKEQNVRFILVKPSDVPTYVDHGVADLGIVGKDTLLEAGARTVRGAGFRLRQVPLVHRGLPRRAGRQRQPRHLPRRHEVPEYRPKLLRQQRADD